MFDNIVLFRWNTVLLYPSDADVDAIQVEPSLQLPADWQLATALSPLRRDGDRIRFAAASLRTVVDSPVLAGRYFRTIALGSIGGGEVRLIVAADSAAQLPTSEEHIEPHRMLVRQAEALFKSRHFRRYEFLVAATNDLSHAGVEHHESSENVVAAEYFAEWGSRSVQRYVLAHEFVHSWNGKFRRPAGHRTRSFGQPLENDLLWVYEGLTEYWGYVLNVRSGL